MRNLVTLHFFVFRTKEQSRFRKHVYVLTRTEPEHLWWQVTEVTEVTFRCEKNSGKVRLRYFMFGQGIGFSSECGVVWCVVWCSGKRVVQQGFSYPPCVFEWRVGVAAQ